MVERLAEWCRATTVIRASRLVWDDSTHVDSDLPSQIEVDIVESFDVGLVDDLVVAMGQLKGKRVDEMQLLNGSEGVVEELCVIVVLVELGATQAPLFALHPLGVTAERKRQKR